MSSPTSVPPPPPEATIIRRAREARGLSPEEAATRVPLRLGGTRWRQIEVGYERRDPFKATRAPARTLAHMALIVGVGPDELSGADRSDAAEVLREILKQQAAAVLAQTDTPPPDNAAEEQRYRRLLHENAIRRGLDKTGPLVDGLLLALREDELWDAAYSVARAQARLQAQRLRQAANAVARAVETGDQKRIESAQRQLADVRGEVDRRQRTSPAQTAYEAVRHLRDLDDAVWLTPDLDGEPERGKSGSGETPDGATNGTEG